MTAFSDRSGRRSTGFAPHHAIDVVREVLPRDGILTFDVGAHTHQIASQWTAHEPGTFLITNGWSSMGFGLPAAIAAKLARPERAVVALVGDGCFQMTVGEVAVARRLGLSLPIVVLDDGWLSLIQVKQVRRRFGLYGTDLGEHEHMDPPAHYFGVPAVGARAADELTRALKDAPGRQPPDGDRGQGRPEPLPRHHLRLDHAAAANRQLGIRAGGHSISTPPSTLKLSPYTKLAASESRNSTALAISSGTAEAAEGNAAGDHRALLRRQRRVHGRVAGARIDAVDPHSGADQSAGEALGHGDDRALGGGVGNIGDPSAPHLVAIGADRHDPPLAGAGASA